MHRLYASVRVKIETEEEPRTYIRGRALEFLNSVYQKIESDIRKVGISVSSSPGADLTMELDGTASPGSIWYDCLMSWSSDFLVALSVAKAIVQSPGYMDGAIQHAAKQVHPDGQVGSIKVTFFELEANRDGAEKSLSADESVSSATAANSIVSSAGSIRAQGGAWFRQAGLLASVVAIVFLGQCAQNRLSETRHKELLAALAKPSADPLPADRTDFTFQCGISQQGVEATKPEAAVECKLSKSENFGPSKIVRIDEE